MVKLKRRNKHKTFIFLVWS